MPREGVKRTFSKAIENADYYWENGFCVFTERFLAKKKQCCGSGCRHCPYLPKHGAGSVKIDPEVLKKL